MKTGEVIGFFIGASGGVDQPTAAIKRLEDKLLLKSFDAKPDQDGIAPICFWSSEGQHPFYHNRTRSSSGLLPANPAALDCLQENGLPWSSEATLIETEIVQTRTLDSYCQETGLWPHFLSMDIQGAEYEVLIGAPRALQPLLAIVTEVEFRQIYLGQKLFTDIDRFLSGMGFQFMQLYVPQYWRLHPADSQKVLTVGEALYLSRPDNLDGPTREKLADIARCFGFQGYVH